MGIGSRRYGGDPSREFDAEVDLEFSDDFDDYEFSDDFDDDLDQALRRQFALALPAEENPSQVYAELRPDIKRARRRHQAKLVLGSTVGALVVVAGLAVSLDRTKALDDTRLLTGPAESVEANPDQPTEQSSSITVLPPVATDDGGGANPELADDPNAEADLEAQTDSPAEPDQSGLDESPTIPNETDDDATTQPSPSADPTSTSPSVTSPPTSSPNPTPSTVVPTSTPTALNPLVINSECGSISVKATGTRLSIVDVTSRVSGQPDIKESGPDKIEVSLEGDGKHCELKAFWRNGKVETSVENEGGGDGHDGDD